MRFAADPAARLLVVDRLPKHGEEESEAESGGAGGGGAGVGSSSASSPRSYEFRVHPHFEWLGERNAKASVQPTPLSIHFPLQLALIKYGPVIEADKPIGEQLGVHV